MWIFKDKLTQKLINKKGEFLNIYAALVGTTETRISKYWRDKPPMDRGENKEWYEKRRQIQKETISKMKQQIKAFSGDDSKDDILAVQQKAYKFFIESMTAIRFLCNDKLISFLFLNKIIYT